MNSIVLCERKQSEQVSVTDMGRSFSKRSNKYMIETMENSLFSLVDVQSQIRCRAVICLLCVPQHILTDFLLWLFIC